MAIPLLPQNPNAEILKGGGLALDLVPSEEAGSNQHIAGLAPSTEVERADKFAVDE